MEKVNYQLVLDNTIKELNNSIKKPRLLLHACCAPCSSYVLEYLNRFFDITLYYYNPNISPISEYRFREQELKRFISEIPECDSIKMAEAPYDPDTFLALAKGHENEKEGGDRCKLCYWLRLSNTAEFAKCNGFDYFTTTLTISPHKNSAVLNEIGKEIAESVGIKYLFSDFKKRNGYKRSCELSVQYNLYRQNYCGCVYSKIESEQRESSKKA